MRLKSLSLKNYRQYKDSTIDFSDGITGIVGMNGAGKSTLVEAIAWTLYGPVAARTEKEDIKRSTAPLAANVETQLMLEIAGTEYKIVRMLKGSSQIGDASIMANGKKIADSVKGVEKEVNYLFGMDWKSFYTSFFARQKELNSLTRLNKSERQEVIIRMLRIDTIDNVLDLIRKRLREGKLLLESLKKVNTLKDVLFLERDKKIMLDKREALSKDLVGIVSTIKDLEDYRSSFKDRFNNDRTAYKLYTETTSTIKTLSSKRYDNGMREKEAQEELKEINANVKSLPELEKAFIKYEALKEQANKMELAKGAIHKSKEQIDSLIDEYKQEINQLRIDENEILKSHICPTCKTRFKDPKDIRAHFNEEVEARESKIKKWELSKKGNGKFDQAKYEEIIEKIRALEKPHKQYPIIQSKIGERSKLEDKLSRIIKEKAEITASIESQSKALADINYNPQAHELINEENDKTDRDLKKSYEKKNQLDLNIQELSQEISRIDKEIKELKDSKEAEKNKTKEQERYQHFLDLVIEYKKHLISQIGPKLSQISSGLLEELTDGKYTGVELNEDYELYIYDGSTKYALSRFSGGEEDLANLCLRLAISQMIAESSGIETGFIILDEIFGSQDMIRKQSIMEALNRLTKQFRQIILITHIEDVKDTIENIIEVAENEEGISYLRV